VPAAPWPETNDRCRAELAQPLTAAGPADCVVPPALGLVVDELLALAEVVTGVPLEGCAVALVVALELEPLQAVRARATTAASGERPTSERGVLTAPTLAKPPGA
jgi:hypothetical protein